MSFLNRKQATRYLQARGIPIGVSFLANSASTGRPEGPLYRYAGKFPIYTPKDLDAWIEGWLSSPVNTTATALRAKPKALRVKSKPVLSPPTRRTRSRLRLQQQEPAST